MTNTSYVSVKVEDLQTACELWLDDLQEFFINRRKTEVSNIMLEDQRSWLEKVLKKPEKFKTEEEAIETYEFRKNYYTTVPGQIENNKAYRKDRVERILLACKTPNFGFVSLSIEDNSILEGYYENLQSV